MTRAKKIVIVVGMVILTALVVREVRAQMRVHQLMINKLTNAQKLLEGIATGKFDKTEKHAAELIEISKTAEWLAYKTPRYEQFSNEFRRAAETIIEKSKAKNIDGVTLAYFDLTMSCVRCHTYVREVRDARGPAPREERRSLTSAP
jgi:preprotein translocase subunit YajC